VNHFKIGILLAGLTALFMGAGFMLAGEGGIIIALVVAIGMSAFAYWNSDSLVLKMYKAREVTVQSSPGF
jgi:heat shock protein HtpX